MKTGYFHHAYQLYAKVARLDYLIYNCFQY